MIGLPAVGIFQKRGDSRFIPWEVTNLQGNARAIAYGNGMFVATGPQFISTSPDGITWTSRTLPVGFNYQNIIFNGNQIAFGNGKFVTMAVNGSSSTSSDGITWTPINNDNLWQCNGVIFASGQFVAYGVNIIFTSPNGTTWTSRASQFAVNEWIKTGVYGNGMFVLISSTSIQTSSDNGVTWTLESPTGLPGTSSYGFEEIAHKDGLFVMTKASESSVFTSTDAISWQASPYIGYHRPSITVGGTSGSKKGKIFIIPTNDGLKYLVSTDGVTWVLEAYGTGGALTHLSAVYADGKFVSVGSLSVSAGRTGNY